MNSCLFCGALDMTLRLQVCGSPASSFHMTAKYLVLAQGLPVTWNPLHYSSPQELMKPRDHCMLALSPCRRLEGDCWRTEADIRQDLYILQMLGWTWAGRATPATWAAGLWADRAAPLGGHVLVRVSEQRTCFALFPEASTHGRLTVRNLISTSTPS